MSRPLSDAEMRAWSARSLREVLQALAAPGEVALAFEPDRTVKAEELALDFEHWRLCYTSQRQGELCEARLGALANVDAAFETIQDQNDPDLWEKDEAVISHPLWAAVRDAAGRALDAFGWPRPSPR